MKKFEGMLFCTDLDGTLYTDGKTVSKENLEAIEYFKSEGGLFTFITGRPPVIAREICDLIRPNAPYGCINGGGIYDDAAQRYLWSKPLPPEALELLRLVDRSMPEIGVQCNTQKVVYTCKDCEVITQFRAKTGLEPNLCHYDKIPDPIMKIVFGHEEETRIQAVIDLLNRHPDVGNFDFVRSEAAFYEMLPKGVGKGAALRKLAELLGIALENTVAVGDYDNDISMIEAAGIGFAVANAIPEAKEAADYVTVSNNEHAISVIIEGLERGLFCRRPSGNGFSS